MLTAVREKVAVGRQGTRNTFDELYRLLNNHQRQAVDTIEGPVMVLAGPGTGKTQVLAMRIARILLATQMDPWNILCLTFTESGVAAMRERLVSIIGEAAYYVRIHTFHSFCNDVIQEFPEKFAEVRAEQVLSDIERVEIFREIIAALSPTSPLKPFGNPYLFLPDIMRNVQALKGEGISREMLTERLGVIQRFVDAVANDVNRFFTMKPTERTEEVCALLSEQLIGVARDLTLAPSLRQPFERIFELYRHRVSVLEEQRGLSRLRTKLNSDLKRWYTTLSGQLPKQRELATLYEAYQRRLVERGRYDYADMILWVVERLQRDEELLARYQEQFQYVLVDEYQDTNSAQNEVLRLLGNYDDRPNIFVVGDDQQSIYRFQGASLENMLYFYESYKAAVTVITLSDTYRSPQVLLDAACAVVAHNEESLSKYIPNVFGVLRDAKERPGLPLQVLAFDTEAGEIYFVARTIQQLIQQGVDPASIAVLYRYHRDADDVVDVLSRLAVPFHVAAGEDVLADVRVHQWLTFLTYLANIEQESLLAAILQYEWLEFDQLDVLRAVRHAGSQRLSLLALLSTREHLTAAGIRVPEVFINFTRNVARWRAASANKTLMAWFDFVLQETGFLRRQPASARRGSLGERPAGGEARPSGRPDGDYVRLLNNLTTLFDEIKRLSYENPHVTLAEFTARLTLLRENHLPLPAQPLQLRQSAVQLMTAHQAKGLEFDHVFIIRLVDRHWGNVRGRSRLPLPHGLLKYDLVAGDANNEDERRLFYVALTRAREQVYLCFARHTAQEREHIPSIFLQELPEQTVERVVTVEAEDEALTRLKAMTLAPLPAQVAIDLKGWLQSVLAYYVMSVTHFNNYLECPRLFYFRNLLHVPSAKTKSMAFGTAVHRALHDLIATFSREGRLPTTAYLLDRFTQYLGAEVLTEREYKDSLEIGLTVLGQYYGHYRNTLIPATMLEYNFRSHGVHLATQSPGDGREASIRLTGQLDKVEVIDIPRKLVNVVDYKTGNPDRAAAYFQPDGKYRRQLVFYKLLCDLSPRFPYEMVSGEIDFVQPSKRTGRLMKKQCTITRGDVAELSVAVRRVWHEILALRFLNENVGCGKCEYCTM